MMYYLVFCLGVLVLLVLFLAARSLRMQRQGRTLLKEIETMPMLILKGLLMIVLASLPISSSKTFASVTVVNNNLVTMNVEDLRDLTTAGQYMIIYRDENEILREELTQCDDEKKWNRYLAFGLGIGVGFIIAN